MSRSESLSLTDEEWDKVVYEQKSKQDELNTTLNPAQFDGQKVAAFPPGNTEIASNFHITRHIYDRAMPKDCPTGYRLAARRQGVRIHADLEVFVAIPYSLIARTCNTNIGVMVEFPGGGGFTGSPNFDSWRHEARWMYAAQAIHSSCWPILVDVGYRLMPEDDSIEILGSLDKFCDWVFTRLEGILQTLNPILKIAWEHFSISAQSFGCTIAFALYCKIMDRATPMGFRVAGIMFRYPVSNHYKRDAREGIKYMGVSVSQRHLEEASERIAVARRAITWATPRAGSLPPNGMWGAPVFACSEAHPWSTMWNGPSIYDLLQRVSHHVSSTVWYIRHGMADVHVRYEDSIELAKLLKACGAEVKLDIVEDEAHAFDFKEELSEPIREFWDRCLGQ
ncbi:hypothetical protein T440DRAFT_523125 [Plenodomus tracheiphilus IPT5]|uniref:Alpha/beta-hydrolase n=1 Tax=Plenodomus tracheiphilus IPT5 TaxID=1408161 RepID=A0A6A7APA7_9PLEO|nr:hypothetical protein T440DRAFT_523125 [Plenodomus tracheiphilus IPT5]